MEEEKKEFDDFNSLEAGLQVEVYGESGKLIDEGIIDLIDYGADFEEERYLSIYSPKMEKSNLYTPVQGYKFKLLSKEHQDLEEFISSEYRKEIQKEYKKHEIMMKSNINKYNTLKDSINKNLRAINILASKQNKYYVKIKELEKDIEVYGFNFNPTILPRQTSDYVLVQEDYLTKLEEKVRKYEEENDTKTS